jgi:glycyl-tRNA synthetase (class II)
MKKRTNVKGIYASGDVVDKFRNEFYIRKKFYGSTYRMDDFLEEVVKQIKMCNKFNDTIANNILLKYDDVRIHETSINPEKLQEHSLILKTPNDDVKIKEGSAFPEENRIEFKTIKMNTIN